MTLARLAFSVLRGVSPLLGQLSRRKTRKIRPQNRVRLGFEFLEQRALLSVTLLSEDFERGFPEQNGWGVSSLIEIDNARWDDVSSSFGGEGTHGGSRKGYCAGIGYAGSSTSPTYRDSMLALMRNSVDLSGLTSASLSFWYKIPSIESGNWDQLGVVICNTGCTTVFAVSTAATSWTKATINLNSYVGENLILDFYFNSDSSGTAEGAYLDDILVTGEEITSTTVDLQGYDSYATDSTQWDHVISVQSQIKNVGTNASGAFQVAWYLSKDSTGSSDDILLNRTNGAGNYYSHAGLAANSNGPDFTVNLQLPSHLPSGWSGTSFYVIQKTDSAGQVYESNENNNFGQIGNGYDRDPITINPRSYPDLQGFDCYATDSAQWGQAISVQSQIKNAGTDASGAFDVAWYLSKDTTGSSDDILLSRTNGAGNYYSHAGIAANSLGPDFTVNLQLPSALPAGWSGTSFYVIQNTDWSNLPFLNNVYESNENNNFGQIGNGHDRDPITITMPIAPPNLQSATAKSYTTVELVWGDVSGEDGYKLFYKLDGSSNWIQGATAARNAMRGTISGLAAGTPYVFGVQAYNRGGGSPFSNQITISTPVQYPDLQGYDCYATNSAQWGQAISVQSQIKNAGTGASGSFQVAWYLSKDSTGSSDDILLSRTNGAGDHYDHAGIAANSRGSDYTVNLQLPFAPPPGWSGTRFYIIQRTDAPWLFLSGWVTESNENNNFGQIGNGRDRDPITISPGGKLQGTLVGNWPPNEQHHLFSINVFLGRVTADKTKTTQSLSGNIAVGVQTWVVIHGRTSNCFDMLSLAGAIDGYKSGDQVLVLDWSEGAADNHESLLPFTDALDGTIWVPKVAQWAADTLASLGISSSQLYLVGHSWGSYVAYEIANRFPGGDERIVALDPARTGLDYPDSQVDFAAVSKRAWAFFGCGLFGSPDYASRADETFLIAYEGVPPDDEPGATEKHWAPVNAFEQLVRRNNKTRDPRASDFSLDKLQNGATRPWIEDLFLGYGEAMITVSRGSDSAWGNAWSEVVKLQYWKSPSSITTV